ncbi:MAG: hypothetical protein Q8Q59_03030 [Luteolibacter sp.]|jgi:adenine-specific DNA-methyltransferase|nr:hypothetical protein [Luteolibacter sp.]
MGKYDSLSKEDPLRLMEARARRDAIRYGLAWETDGIEAEQELNGDYVAFDLVPELCCGPPPWRNLLIQDDNFDALRAPRPGFSGKDDLRRHSKWLEFIFLRLTLTRDLLAEDGAAFLNIDDNEVPAQKNLSFQY